MILFFNFLIFILISLFAVKYRNLVAVVLPLLGGIVFSLSGLAAPKIWDWSRQFTGLGLLSSMTLSESQTKLFREIFSWGAIGCLFSAMSILLVLELSKSSLRSANLNDFNSGHVVTDTFGRQAAFFGILTIILFAIALGDSLLITSQYLEAQGNPVILRIVSSLVVGLIPILIYACRGNRYAKLNTILLLIIFLILLGRGSRLSTILLVVALCNHYVFGRKSLMKLLLTLIMIIFVLAIGIKINNLARIDATGIFSIPDMVARLLGELPSFENSLSILGEAAASLTSWVPIVIASIGTIKKELILENMNPLIGTGSNPYDYSSEGISVFFPYLWTPLSTIGQLYGFGGGLLICLISFVLSAFSGAAFIKSRQYRGILGFAIAGMAIYFYQFLMFFQYSTRNWFRAFWVLIFLASIQLYLTFSPQKKRVTEN